MANRNGHRGNAPHEPALPFLKWLGGKRWLVGTLLKQVEGRRFWRYFEPFLGGGAFFFALRPSRAVLSDINPDLINVYRQVKHHRAALIDRLQELPVNERTYDRLRGWNPERVLDRAVRFLYLNRTAFGGMYRLNRNGQFNVPFGGGDRTPSILCDSELLCAAATSLRACQLRVCDFAESMNEAGRGDLVYCDPTYTVAHNNNGFVRYNEKNFSWADQQRLAVACRAAARRGAVVIVSNAVHADVLKLFDPPEWFAVRRQSSLCPKAEHRRETEEYVFLFHPVCGGRG